MRQFIWSVTARKKLLRKESKQLQDQRQRVSRQLDLLQKEDPLAVDDPKDREMVLQVVLERAKDKADALIREIQYRQAYLTRGGQVISKTRNPIVTFPGSRASAT